MAETNPSCMRDLSQLRTHHGTNGRATHDIANQHQGTERDEDDAADHIDDNHGIKARINVAGPETDLHGNARKDGHAHVDHKIDDRNKARQFQSIDHPRLQRRLAQRLGHGAQEKEIAEPLAKYAKAADRDEDKAEDPTGAEGEAAEQGDAE